VGETTIALRPVESERDLEDWARLKSAVVPNEPVTPEQLRATDRDGRLLLLAEAGMPKCRCRARSR